MSMVKSVELLLKMEVSEDIRAAIITAIMSPLKPETHTQMFVNKNISKYLRYFQMEIFENIASKSYILTTWHEFND